MNPKDKLDEIHDLAGRLLSIGIEIGRPTELGMKKFNAKFGQGIDDALAEINKLYILRSDVEEAIGKEDLEDDMQCKWGHDFQATVRNELRRDIRQKLGIGDKK